MGSAVIRIVAAVAGVGTDAGPYVPSTPVEIGTTGAPHRRSELGYWQLLIVMFIAAIIIGTLVLMYVVRQRGRVLKRRRLRRMAEAVPVAGAVGDTADAADATAPHRRHQGPPGRERVT